VPGSGVRGALPATVGVRRRVGAGARSGGRHAAEVPRRTPDGGGAGDRGGRDLAGLRPERQGDALRRQRRRRVLGDRSGPQPRARPPRSDGWPMDVDHDARRRRPHRVDRPGRFELHAGRGAARRVAAPLRLDVAVVGRDLGAGQAEAALALTELIEAAVQLVAAEVGPHDVDEDELGVGQLPQHEVRDALLAAGADEQIEGRQLGGRQVAAEAVGVDRARIEGARGDVPGQGGGGGGEGLAAAVGQREGQGHAAVVSRVAAQGVEGLADHRRQAIEVADRVQPDLVVHDLGPLVAQVVAQQLHQALDLVGRPRPVLRREGVEGDGLDAELPGGAGDVADALGADPVTLEARLTA
jgi:hypothetical protein